MRLHVGCELTFDFPQTTPMVAMLNVHFSRVSDLERPDYLVTEPSVPIESYRDSFGNWCNRLVAPAGRFNLRTDTIVRDAGAPDPVALDALQHQVQHLPAETGRVALVFTPRSGQARAGITEMLSGAGFAEQHLVEGDPGFAALARNPRR
jgi:hypothetical protein